jgi:hypothetical protein
MIFYGFMIAAAALPLGTAESEPSAWRVASTGLSSKLSSLRVGPRAIALPDGSALILGGGLDTLERFDPETNRISRVVKRLNRRRLWPTVTLLVDGRVLIAGGAKHKGYGDTAEVFDPASGTVSELVQLERIRVEHTATRLDDGRVLLAGGDASAEIFDPVTLTTAGPFPLLARRRGHTATSLTDGRILLAGGGRDLQYRSRSEGYRSAELFDPATRSATLVDELMRDQRDEHIALPLPNDRVLLAGGQRRTDAKTHNRSDIFDLTTGKFTQGPNLPIDGQDAQVIRLDDGSGLILGGESDDGWGGKRDVILDQIVLFDPATMRFTTIGRMKIPRDDFAACRLKDGRILVAGGLTRGDFPTLSAELLTIHRNEEH